MTQTSTPSRTAVQITLKGRVQGVGMRPAIARLAAEFELAGSVENTAKGVIIHVEGPSRTVPQFEQALLQQLPSTADVAEVRRAAAKDRGFTDFRIVAEETDCADAAPLDTEVPLDCVVCDSCRDEVLDPSNRRHGYAMTSCTDCGPRYTIVDRMPYERRQTTMFNFPLCESCGQEYSAPQDRRFHAQTNACPTCGPNIWIRNNKDQCLARREAAISTAAAALRDGKIVGIQGMGGYQLLVDATCDDAVQRLRSSKRRPSKPFAVMVDSLTTAEELAWLDDRERAELASPRGPIVIARARAGNGVSHHVSQGTIGLLLPTTPLHVLLMSSIEMPVACTSGNFEGEPLPYLHNDAQLNHIAQLWLEHDRPVRRPLDDSVVRVIAGQTAVFRLARGYAPLSLAMDSEGVSIALGGQLKQALALSNGAQTVLGPHIGNLGSYDAILRFQQHLDDISQLYNIDPTSARLISDLHPDYFSSGWAEQHSTEPIRVQHHHAHIAAAMLDNGWLDREVLGIAMDGSGYGPDETIWGGEILRTTARDYERVGHLRPFALAGGDQAVREPWRVAVALLGDALDTKEASELSLRLFPSQRVGDLQQVLSRPETTVQTTSVGRLFDGVAAIILGITWAEHEGQAAMALEQLCDTREEGQYAIPWTGSQRPGANSPWQLDWRPMIRQLTRDLRRETSSAVMAMRFHRGLAAAIDQCCQTWPHLPVALGGGVFQNRVLVETLVEQFHQRDTPQPLGLPRTIPVNDGGISAGQLVVAQALAHPPE